MIPAAEGTPSFFEECLEVLKRVFTPSAALHRGIVSINSRDTGYIGLDKARQFSKHLSTINGEPITPERRDCYLTVLVTMQPPKYTYAFLEKVESVLSVLFGFIPKPTLPPQRHELPASLFRNAQEGSKILYRYDQVPMQLTLTQRNDPNAFIETFQGALEEVIQEANVGKRYRYALDVPHDELTFRGVLVEQDACFFDGTLKALPLEQAQLTEFAKKLQPADTAKMTWTCTNDNVQHLRFNLPGVEKEAIRLFLNGTTLSFVAPREGDVFCREQTFDKKIDPQSLRITVKNGLMDLDFRFVS